MVHFCKKKKTWVSLHSNMLFIVYSCEQDMKIIQQRISNKKLNKMMVDFEGGALVA